MSKKEMLERSQKALADFDSLPAGVQFQKLVEWGVIDQQGDVVFGHHSTGDRSDNLPRMAVPGDLSFEPYGG